LASTILLLLLVPSLLLWALFSRSWHWRDWWSRSWCMWGVWVSTVLGVLVSTILLLGVWTLLVPPHSGIEREWLIGYRPWLDGVIHRNLVLSERTLMRKEPPAELLFDAYQDTKQGRARVWLEAGEALDLRGWDLCDWDRCAEGQCEPDLCRRDLRYADFSDSDLWDADLRGAQLQGAALEGAQLQGAVLSGAEIEELEARLEQAGKHWPQEGWKRVERAIERFWSIAFDLPLQPTTISPNQGSNMMYDLEGLFAEWPAPPDVAEFEQARAEYRAGLACKNRYIAKRMWRYATGDEPWLDEGDPVLEQVLRDKAGSGDCPDLAEVLK